MRAPERGTTYKTRGRRGARRVHGQTHRRTGQKGEAALPAGRPAHPRPARRTRHQPRTDRLALRLLMGHATPQHRRPGLLRVRQELDRLRPGASGVPQPVPFPLHPRPRPRGGMASGRRQAPRTVQTAQTLQRVHGPRARSNGCSNPPEERFRGFLFELMERRHDTGSTLFATQYPQKDWHQRLGGGTHADAIMDRIVHNTTWIETGDYNMREHAPGR